MSRKTTPVRTILDNANKMLRRTDKFATAEFKIGIICMLEGVLHATDNYRGFQFIDNDDSETGTLGYYSRQYFYSDIVQKTTPDFYDTRYPNLDG